MSKVESENLPQKVSIKPARFISAIGTPLNGDECLHEEGLEKHLLDQWTNGIDGVLVAGTLGLMQLLREQTYRRLVELTISFSSGCGDIFVGAGDTGFFRTRDRIELLNNYTVDGVVVLAPYFLKFTQKELIDYYRSLASVSRNPLYLYDMPSRTGTKLELQTVLRLAEHPNIYGIKCSCEWEWTSELLRRVDDRFRVIAVETSRMDSLIREGVVEFLDGLFALLPAWTVAIGRAAAVEDWERAAGYRQRLTHMLGLMRKLGSFATLTVLLNARGIPGNYAPAPLHRLTDEQCHELMGDSVVRQLLEGIPLPLPPIAKA